MEQQAVEDEAQQPVETPVESTDEEEVKTTGDEAQAVSGTPEAVSGAPAANLFGGASSSTEELVQVIVKSLKEIGVEEMDIQEIMQLVKVKVKKLRYSIRLPGEDPRRPIIQQLVAEEHQFVSNLDALVTKYLTPLRNAALGIETPSTMKGRFFEITGGPPLRKGDVDTIFGNIEEIQALHVVLYDRLRVCLNQWPKVSVGGVLSKLIPKMKFYVYYVSHFNAAIDTLRACVQSSKAFAAFLQKVGSPQHLERLLQAPLQHLTRYKLVLKMLEEQTPITNREHSLYSNALKGLKELQNTIHSNRQRAMRLLGVQNRIQGFKGIVEPDRVLINEGPLALYENGSKQDGYAFLFNDMLLFGIPASGSSSIPQYRFKVKIPINGDLVVKEGAPTHDPQTRHSITLVSSEQKINIFVASKASKREEWIQHIYSAVYHGTQHKIFGIRLGHLLKRENRLSTIPLVAENAIKHLDELGLDTEGLFRISASAFAINQIRDAIDSGVPVDFSSVDNHVVAGLLKLFFRELPDCIVPTGLYRDFISFNETSNPTARLAALVDKLAPHSYNLLSHLIHFLTRVAAKSEVNKMTASNLGVVFGPNIIWDDNDNDINNSLKVNAVLEHMINHYHEVFVTPTKDASSAPIEEEEEEEEEASLHSSGGASSSDSPSRRKTLTSIAKKIGSGNIFSKARLVSTRAGSAASIKTPATADSASNPPASPSRPKPKHTPPGIPGAAGSATEEAEAVSPREAAETAENKTNEESAEQTEQSPSTGDAPEQAESPKTQSRPPPSGAPPGGPKRTRTVNSNTSQAHPRGMRPESTLPCSVCRKLVAGRGVKVLGGYYHVECFVCFHCKQPFPGGAFMMGKDGELYCAEDFRSLFGKCKACGQPTLEEEEVVEVLNAFWHTSCFVCTTCRKAFANGRFLNRGGMPYCKECAPPSASAAASANPSAPPSSNPPASAPPPTPSS